MPRSRKDAEAVADKLGLTGDDREEYVVRLSGEAAAPAAPAPKPAAPPQPPYLIPDGGFDGVAPERKAPTRPAIKAPAPAPAPVVIAPDDMSGLVGGENIIPRPQPAEQVPTRMRPLSSLPGDAYAALVEEAPAALPPPTKPDARRQVVSDTLGLPGAKVYREQPAAPRAAPVDAFRADYEFLVSQGYPQAQLDQFIAEKGAAELSKVAASKRGGK